MKPLRRDVHPVPVNVVPVDQHHRDHLDTVGPDDLLGEVGSTVGENTDWTARESEM